MADKLHVVCPHCDTINRVACDRLADDPKCGNCKQPLFTARPVALTGTKFERHVSASDIPVVVDFWAPWCGPCRMMAPAYEEAAARLEPGVRLAKLDTEAAPEIAARYGIRSIPMLILFAGGREIARHSGAFDLSRLLQWVESHARSVNVSEALHERHQQAEIRRHRR